MKAFLFFLLLIGLHNRMQAQSNGDSAYCLSYFNTELKKEVFRNPEIAPAFPGGTPACMRFLNKHFRLPQDVVDSEDALSTKVSMNFIVDSDGQLYFIVLNGKKDTASFNPVEREVMRVLKLMPKWEPGICKGRKAPTEVDKQFLACVLLNQE